MSTYIPTTALSDGSPSIFNSSSDSVFRFGRSFSVSPVRATLFKRLDFFPERVKVIGDSFGQIEKVAGTFGRMSGNARSSTNQLIAAMAGQVRYGGARNS